MYLDIAYILMYNNINVFRKVKMRYNFEGGSDIEYLEHGISFFSRTEISNLYLVMDKVSYELIDG